MNPNSSPTSYLAPVDFLKFRDVTSIYQYCSDGPNWGQSTNTGGPPVSVMTAALLDSTTPQGGVLAESLATSSGMLESAVLRSGRYAVGDLQALLSLGGNSAAYLKSVIASIVMYNLIIRRPGPAPPETAVHAYTEAIKALNDLSDGVRIFAFQETEQAGLPATRQFSATDFSNNNLLSVKWYSMYGTRQITRRYLPGGGWGAGGLFG